MNVLPVITRELRAQARQPFTYFIRMLGVLALLGGGAMFAVEHSFGDNLGGELFRYFHLTLFIAIWILVPLSTADCISRERREGTLGLLFLTPLEPADIVIAKGLAHGLRAMTLLVAVLPVLTIPFLLGGVSWQHTASAALTNFNAVCWALAAALAASSVNRSGLRALAGAMIFAACGFISFGFVTGGLVQLPSLFRYPLVSNRTWVADYTILFGFNVAGLSTRNLPFGFRGLTQMDVLFAMLQCSVVSLCVLATAVLLAAWQIRRSWREEPPPVWVQKWQKKFCTPVLWLGFFRRWMRWKLQRNPIGWLEQRTWQGRLVTWAWFAVIISIYSAVFTDSMFFRNFSGFQVTLAWLLMGSIASSAAGSFRRERESGVLELLLVAPLTSGQIIGGRLRGLWGQFFPAVGMLLGVWMYFDIIFKNHEATGPILFFAFTVLTLPVIGLYFSVRCRNFLSAFLLTLIGGLGVPLALRSLIDVLTFLLFGPAMSFVISPDTPPRFWEIIPSLAQGAVAGVCLWQLRRRLETRSFPLERTAP
jgi:ABC-type transport system involved in cytochrome c biogenesis permease component